MNKYKYEYKKIEKYPRKINDIKFDLLLLKTKLAISSKYGFVKYRDLKDTTCYRILFSGLHLFDEKDKRYIKEKIISRMNKNDIYRYYLQHLSNALCLEDYKEIDNTLLTCIELGFIKDGRLVYDNKIIELTLPNDEKVLFHNAVSNPDMVSNLNRRCHSITSEFLNLRDKKRDIAIVLEDNLLFGKHYHSFLVEDEIIRDYAHNIVINYDAYLRLVNPTVLVKEDSVLVRKRIEELSKEKSFSSCSYPQVLKYGMSKQMTKSYNTK